MGLNTNPYSNTPIKNLEYIQNKALVIAPFEITKSGLLDTDLMLDTPGTITMYFFRKTFNDIDKEPTAEQFKTVGNVSDINTKLGLDISASNISSSSSSSYYLGFTKISVIFKYDKNTGVRTIEKDTSLLGGNYIDIGIDNTIDLTTEDYFVICNVTKNTKATNSEFTDTIGMDFLFMIPSGECQEIITDFDILDTNNKTINIKKCGALGSGFVIDNDTTIEPAYEADFFGDGSNIATYLFDGTCEDLNGNYNGTPTSITYGEGKFGQAAVFNGTTSACKLDTYDLSSTKTISLWFKFPTNVNVSNFSTLISSKEYGQQSKNNIILGIYQNNLCTWHNGTKQIVSGNTFSDNLWHHIIISKVGNDLYDYYLDGVKIASNLPNNNASLDVMYIGRDNKADMVDNCFTGSIDQVRIFNRALNQNEVTALYLNNGSTRVIKQESNVVNDNWTQIQLETVEPIQAPSIVEQTGKVITNTGITVDTTNVSAINKINSMYFNGSSALSIPASNDFSFSTGNFTIELMVNIKSYPSNQYDYTLLLSNRLYSAGLAGTWGINLNSGSTPGKLSFGEVIASPTQVLYSNINLALNTWYHIAFVRNNGKLSLYIDGILDATVDHTINYSVTTQPLLIGNSTDANGYFNGYMQDIRITKGVALYSSNFIPKTDLVKDTNTSLLIQSYQISPTIKDPKRKDFFGDKSMVACYMLDSNANDETGFYNGTLSGSNFTFTSGKFGQCVSVNSTNYINLPETLSTIFGTNDFSISLWFKPSGTLVTHNILFATQSSNISGFFTIILIDNKILAGVFDGSARPGITHQDNILLTDWNHVVVTKESNIYKIYSNNVVSSTTLTSALSIACGDIRIGQNPAAPSLQYFNGQIDNVKIFNRALTDGEVTSLYNETISPIITLETESETIASEPDFFNDKSNIATYLFDNKVNDANDKYNGTATNITYGAGKFGNCANFDGNLSLIDIPNTLTSQIKAFSANIKFNTTYLSSTYYWQFSSIICWSNTTLNFGILANGKIRFYWYDGEWKYFDGTTVLTAGIWYNISFSINSNMVYVYLNGSLEVSGSFTNFVIGPFTGLRIGYDNSANKSFDGQIDNVRIFNRALTASEVQDLYGETKRVKYKAITLDETNFGPASKFIIETQKEIKLLNYKTWTGSDNTTQGYRIYPVMNISDHTAEETTFNPKYYLGTKYQRNLSEILSQGIKSKRTISNLKDMYLVDDFCIQTLKKINILLENDQMIKFSERLYQNGIREKINADLILEYLSIPVSGSSNNDINSILKTSLIEDYNFTQEEIDNLNDNLNTFKSRARIVLSTPVIQGSGLDQLRFNLPKTFIDNNRSKTEKKNLLVFGTDAGFDKFNLAGYTAPYSNISRREASLDYTSLVAGLPNISSKYSKLVVDDKTFMMYSGSLTDATGKRPTLTGVSLSTTTKKFNDSSIYINNSFITIPAGANLSIGTKDFTIETWINPTSISDIPIFTLGLNQSQCCFIVQLSPTGRVEFRAGSGGWSWDFVSSRTTASNLVKANTWNHIVTQRRNGNLEIYINGILSYTGVWAYNIPNGTNLYIGGYVGDSNITAYYDDISISNGVGRYTSNFIFEMSNTFKDILTNYKQQIPFTYIPLSTDIKDINDKPVFETLTNITGFCKSEIIIDIPNVL